LSTTADFKNGIVIDLNGSLLSVIEFQHVKPGKGGAFVRTKLKNVQTGQVLDKTFRAGEKIINVRLDKVKMQYLYNIDNLYYFMNEESFEQIPINETIIADSKKFLYEGMSLGITFHGDEPINLELPIFIEMKVNKTDPGLRGDTASGGTKPATLESGAVVNVPLFIEEGNTIKVDTRTGEYMERVSS